MPANWLHQVWELFKVALVVIFGVGILIRAAIWTFWDIVHTWKEHNDDTF
jgi:hypothetical protein